MRHITIIVTLLISVTLIGCGDPSRPSDLPKLYPCVITITQDGKPLEGAVVELIPAENAAEKYRISTVTDAAGQAVLSTYGYAGVPADRYKAVVTKMIEDDLKYGKNDEGGQIIVSSVMYRTVGEQYEKAETTPLEIEVAGKGKSEKTFDVGNAVKVKIE